jgi:Domain of unknown function (DUF4180)
MEYKEHIEDGINVVEIIDKDMKIKSSGDFLDVICNVPSKRIAVHKENIVEEFFDLKTGIAGEILQKASNYNIRFGIIGDFSQYKSKSLKDFIYESNKTGQVVFLENIGEVIKVFCDRKYT